MWFLQFSPNSFLGWVVSQREYEIRMPSIRWIAPPSPLLFTGIDLEFVSCTLSPVSREPSVPLTCTCWINTVSVSASFRDKSENLCREVRGNGLGWDCGQTGEWESLGFGDHSQSKIVSSGKPGLMQKGVQAKSLESMENQFHELISRTKSLEF